MLWILQVLLAGVFGVSGSLKSAWSRSRLVASGQTGVAVFPMPVVRFTACCELLGAAGLVLPWLTGVAAFLTPLAAGGLAVVMVGAVSAHVRLREPVNTLATSLILVAAVTVCAGRM
jgi:TctA family transporter